MIALLDLGLFVIDPGQWDHARDDIRDRFETLEIHAPFIRKYRNICLLWTDEFFEGFPWNGPSCPQGLRDVYVALMRLLDEVRGQERIIGFDALCASPPVITITPDPLAENPPYPEDFRTFWQWLLSAALFGIPRPEGALCIPSWPRSRMHDVVCVDSGNDHAQVPLLVKEEAWSRFLERHHRPDLTGRRILVLVGAQNRLAFERARRELETYGACDCRRLPPLFEMNRKKNETRDRLKKIDLLVVCTNRISHADSDHLDGELSCAVQLVDNDSEKAIVDAVLRHFREHEA